MGDKQKTQLLGECFYGAVTVGERGQIVIPADARHEIGIQPGDKLLIMRHPIYDGLMVAKIEALTEFIDEFNRRLREAQEAANEVSN